MPNCGNHQIRRLKTQTIKILQPLSPTSDINENTSDLGGLDWDFKHNYAALKTNLCLVNHLYFIWVMMERGMEATGKTIKSAPDSSIRLSSQWSVSYGDRG